MKDEKKQNPWIKINSKKDVPKKEGWYWVCLAFNRTVTVMDISKNNPYGESYMLSHCSHYKEMDKQPEPPCK